MFTALSYIGAHWFLILSVVLGTAALAAFAWFTKNWRAALAAIVLVMAGLFYQSADLGGYKRALDEQKAAEIQTLQTRLLTVSMLNANDAKRAVADQFVLTQLEKLASETPVNLGPCLDAAAAHRVWAVRALNAGATPLPARRVPNVFQRPLKRP